MSLTVGSLFSGIGGLDLGLERAGMTVAWQSEIDPYCTRILNRHWPHVPNLGDVTAIEWENVPRVDLICGGYPCQPFSLAGRRLGADDPRHLWPHMLNAIRILRPQWALLENVPGHLALGFGRVLGDLAEIGFDAEWDCVPAAAVGAPHLRWRIFIIATRRQTFLAERATNGVVADTLCGSGIESTGQSQKKGRWHPDLVGECSPPVADTDSSGLEGRGLRRSVAERRGDVADTDSRQLRKQPFSIFRRGYPSEPVRSGWWAVEPDVGRVAHGIPHRVDRLRALGNAVVPQVAEHIGRLIVEAAA